MKKIISIFGCTVLAGMAVISCKKESALGQDSEGELKQGTIEVETEQTKTDLGAEGYIVWSEGDKIGLFSTDGTLDNVEATLDAGSAGQNIGKFGFTYSGTIEGKIYAYYPYKDGVTFSGTTFSNLVLPCNQTYESLGEAIKGCILVGQQMEDGKVHFVNTLSIAKISLTGSEDLSQVALWGRDESLSGYGSVTITEGREPVFAIANNAANSGKSTGAVFATKYTGSKATDGEKLTTLSGEAYDLYFTIPVRNYDVADLLMDVITPSYSLAKQSTLMHKFSRNTCKPFASFAVAKPEYQNLKDLSKNNGETEYSNCYLLSPSSSAVNCSIAARGADGSLRFGNADATLDAPGATARLVWESYEGLVTNLSVDWEAKTIRFTVPGTNTAGSAVIAIVNQYNNSVYWLWHIWISPDVEDLQWGNSPAFLDRNLGAEWTPKTVAEVESLTEDTAVSTSGLFFQYGNSYPFPRANTMEPGTTGKTRNQEANAFQQLTQGVLVYHFGKWTQGFYSAGRALSATAYKMDDLRWYPMAFNYDNVGGSANVWACGWASDVNPLTAGNRSWGTGEDKALRDPCPVGYKVPSDEEMSWFRRPQTGKSSDSNVFYWQYLASVGKSVCTGSGDYVNKGFPSFGAFQTTSFVRDASKYGEGKLVWFPKQGVRMGKGFGNAGAIERVGSWNANANPGDNDQGVTMLWAVRPSNGAPQEGGSSVLSSMGNINGCAEVWFLGKGNLFPYGSMINTSCAAAVRCVKMNSQQIDTQDGDLDAGSLDDGGTDPNPWN